MINFNVFATTQLQKVVIVINKNNVGKVLSTVELLDLELCFNKSGYSNFTNIQYIVKCFYKKNIFSESVIFPVRH